MPVDWPPLWLTLRCSGLATLCCIPPGLTLAAVLARRRFRGSELLDAAASLPMVLPPAVLVYYLVAALGRWPVVFSWNRAVALSTVYTLPLFFRMARAGFEGVDHAFENAARSLGASEWRVFWRITAPLSRHALAGAALAAFARSLADFGLTAVAAGSITDTRLIPVFLLALGAAALLAFYAGNRLRRARIQA